MIKKNNKMLNGVKDAMSIVIAESTGNDQKEVRKWLDTVKTAEDFFGNNRQGLAEYKSFIASKEAEYNRAVQNSLKRI